MQQLMAVLPPYSCDALPPTYQKLMLEEDSEIIDFYPSDFRVDVKGKRFAWLGEVLLPLIDPERLKKATDKIKHTLTEEEKERNVLGDVLIFRRLKGELTAGSPNLFEEVKGQFEFKDVGKIITLHAIKKDLESHVVVAAYNVPEFSGHVCELLKGVDLPVRNVRDVSDGDPVTRLRTSIKGQ